MKSKVIYAYQLKRLVNKLMIRSCSHAFPVTKKKNSMWNFCRAKELKILFATLNATIKTLQQRYLVTIKDLLEHKYTVLR